MATVAGADVVILADLEPTPFVLNVDELDRDESVLTPSDEALSDIACQVVHATWSWGATTWAGPLTKADAGEATFVVADPTRRYDPANAAVSRPVQLGSPIVVLVDGANAWGGYVRSVEHDYGAGLTTLEAADAIMALAQVAYDGLTVAGTSWAVMASILDRSAWPAHLRVTHGAPAAYRSAGADPENAWGALVRNAEAEGGLIWVDRQGRVAQASRGLTPVDPVWPPTIGCGGADLGELVTSSDRQGIINHVQVDQDDTNPTTSWHDPVSEAAYGRRTFRVERAELRLTLPP